MSRPYSVIDWERVDELLIKGCGGKEISGFLGIDDKTLYTRCVTERNMTFTEYRQMKKSKGDSLLRERQYDKAVLEGDTRMLIFLGKNRLKQTERQDIVMSNIELYQQSLKEENQENIKEAAQYYRTLINSSSDSDEN